MLSPDQATTASAKRDVLQALAQVLMMLAGRLQAQQRTVAEISILCARAEALAAKAHTVGSSRVNRAKGAAELADELTDFIRDSVALAERAAKDSAAAVVLADTMQEQSMELQRIGSALDEAADIALVRSLLRPMLLTLAGLPARMQGMTAIAADVADLGRRAKVMSDSVGQLQRSSPSAADGPFIVYRALRDFAEAAHAASAAMSANVERAQSAITTMVGSTGDLAAHKAPDAEAPLLPHMHSIIAEGLSARRSHVLAPLPSSD